jgi:hypothetical protein
MEPGLLANGAMDGAAQPKGGCQKTGTSALALPRRNPVQAGVIRRFGEKIRHSCEMVSAKW